MKGLSPVFLSRFCNLNTYPNGDKSSQSRDIEKAKALLKNLEA